MNQTGDKPGPAYQISNPEEFARNVLKLLEEGGRAMSGLLERPDTKISAYSAGWSSAQRRAARQVAYQRARMSDWSATLAPPASTASPSALYASTISAVRRSSRLGK